MLVLNYFRLNNHDEEKEKTSLLFNIHDKKWEKKYQQLLKFKEQFGHVKVPTNEFYTNLNKWIHQQKHSFKNGTLKPDRIERLQKLGLDLQIKPKNFISLQLNNNSENHEEKEIIHDEIDSLNKLEESWNIKIQELLKFKEKYGHCNVTSNHIKEWKGLYHWVQNTR